MRVDNNLTGSIHIDNGIFFPFPELKLQPDLLIDESKIIWSKENKRIDFKIKNRGLSDAEGFYITIKYQKKHNRYKELIRFWIASLEAGKSITKSFNLNAYASRYNDYLQNVEKLLIIVDDSHHVKEWNEKNNIELIDLNLHIRKDYSPGEKNRYRENSKRNKQWTIEWNEVNEDLDTKAYRNLIRAPYIQNVTPHSAVVLWRTIAKTEQAEAIVKLYEAETNLLLRSDGHSSIQVLDATSNYVYDNNDIFKDDDQLNIKGSGQYRPNLEYRVSFTHLSPNTRYWYSIEAVGEDENRHLIMQTLAEHVEFKTAPSNDYDNVIKFIAMGDFGQGDNKPSYVYDVFDLMHRVVRHNGIDFWLALGDIDNCTDGHPNAIDPFFFSLYNAYLDEVPKKTSALKFAKTTTVKAFRTPPYYGILGGMPLYPTFGNHDIRDAYANYDKVDKYSSWKQAYQSSFLFPSSKTDSWSLAAYNFNKKGEGFFYTYRYANIIAISLAVPGASDKYNSYVNKKIEEQNKLLEQYLKEIENITRDNNIWLIVYAHDHHILDRETYGYNKLFHQYHVNLVLSGHHHFYQERASVHGNIDKGFSQNTPYDLVHFISGTGGYGDNDQRGAAPSRRPGFISFEIKGNKLKYCKYDTHQCDKHGYPIGGRDGIDFHIEEQGKLIQDKQGKLIYSPCDSPVFKGEAYIPPKLIKYHIKVDTGDVVHAGTDADVAIKLYGTQGETAFIQLDSPRDNFEKNDNDHFVILYEDIGNIEKIELKHSNTGDSSGWFLEKVEIIKGNHYYNFTAKQWLSSNNKNIEPSITIKEDSKRLQYHVTVKTSRSKKAGTDASVYIQLFGQHGKKTALQRIDKKEIDDFEKGDIGNYTIYADEDLGEINQIKLEHDNTGDGAGWKIAQVVINNHYVFNINEWLESSNKNVHPSKIFRR